MKIHIIWYNSCIRIKCLLFCILSVMYSTLTIRVYWVNLDKKKEYNTWNVLLNMDLILHLAPKAKLPSIFTFDVILLWEVNSCLIHVHMAVLVIINICLWCKLVIKDVLMSMILLFIIAVICWIYVWNCCKTLKQVMFPSCSVLYLNYICEYNFFHKNCFCSFTFFFS